jgi:homoaconitate hydratase
MMNAIEKVVARAARRYVQAGDFVCIRPKHVLTHDNTSAILGKFRSWTKTSNENTVYDFRQPVVCLDHDVQNQSSKHLDQYDQIQRFCAEQQIDFHAAGTGVGHQVLIERGYTQPGSMVVAADSHATMYGGVGCLGTPVVRTDAVAVWIKGQTWWQVPKVARIQLQNRLRPGTTTKDLVLQMLGHLPPSLLAQHAIEFHGPGLTSLSIEQRLTVANMTSEMGAVAGLFPMDERLIDWWMAQQQQHRIKWSRLDLEQCSEALQPDPKAQYHVELDLDLDSVQAGVTGPNTLMGKTRPINEVESQRIPIDKAYLVSCTNARTSDLEEAVEVLRGKQVDPRVELVVAPASRQVQTRLEASGAWQVLQETGATLLPPGCGPCIGLGAGLLQPGQTGISASNRNFAGRMGSVDAKCYLASPAIVAASAIRGYIAAPRSFEQVDCKKGQQQTQPLQWTTRSFTQVPTRSHSIIPLVPGFPRSIKGQVVLCPGEQISTDAIYPSQYTYRDDLSAREQAALVLQAYDPKFASVISNCAAPPILVAGPQFGWGSSREQAVTALQATGIPLVLAPSLSPIFQRNAFNHGMLALECPSILERLSCCAFKSESLSVKTQLLAIHLELDFIRWQVQIWESSSDREMPLANMNIDPIGPEVQEIVRDGLEMWVKASHRP